MKIERKSAVASAIDIIVDGLNRKKSINVIHQEVSIWIDGVRKGQSEVFGEALTLPMTEDHIRSAAAWLRNREK